MLYQIFLSPQVKGSTIISYKHDIYELPHELLNELRLRTLGNQESLKPSMNDILKILAKTEVNFSPSALFHVKTRVSLKYNF